MTPQEQKAGELVEKFYYAKDEDGYYSTNKYRAKQCALICVDEIIESHIDEFTQQNECADYWNEVKTEINKL